MSEALVTYINDHIGGAQIAIQLLQAMSEQHDDPRFRKFAETLFPEVRKDEQTLQSLAEALGVTSTVKKAGGWLLEKAARLKLGHTGGTNFEMIESLELLALGVQGKLGLWKALQEAAKLDARLRSKNFEELVRRAEQQFAQVESERLDLARTVLAPVA